MMLALSYPNLVLCNYTTSFNTAPPARRLHVGKEQAIIITRFPILNIVGILWVVNKYVMN